MDSSQDGNIAAVEDINSLSVSELQVSSCLKALRKLFGSLPNFVLPDANTTIFYPFALYNVCF